MSANPLRSDRIPASLEEARTMVTYNEGIVASSRSPQRIHRAQRMLENLKPHVERLEHEEAARVRRIETSRPPAQTIEGQLQRMRDRKNGDDEFETVWDGTRGRAGASLSSWK